MPSENVPPALVACVSSVRAVTFEYIGDDTFALTEGREVSLVGGETLKELLKNLGGHREVA